MFAKEVRPAFDKDLPVAVSFYRTTRQMPHYHKNTIEMILCLKGEVNVYNMHQKHILHPGDMTQTDMFDIHSISSDSNNLVASIHFDLNHPLFRNKGYHFLWYECSSDTIVQSRIPHINRLCTLILSLLTCYIEESGDSRIIKISEKLLQIVHDHFQYYDYINIDEKMYPPEMKERFERIMAYMLEHYAEKITMKDICNIEYISYNYLSQFFKDSSLKTFRNFLHEIRIYHSEHLLLCYPEIRVPDVGYRVGFSDPKFYYREFKKKHGHTPHQHRIWYRQYNKRVMDDTILSISENAIEIKECIIKLFSNAAYFKEIDSGE